MKQEMTVESVEVVESIRCGLLPVVICGEIYETQGVEQVPGKFEISTVFLNVSNRSCVDIYAEWLAAGSVSKVRRGLVDR